jgi:hypothetical protein
VQPFDSNKILRRIFRGECGEEGPVAATEIDFDWRTATKDARKIERFETIRRDEFDLACYGLSRGHFR